MRRPLLALFVILLAIGAFTGGLAWLLDTPKPPAGASSAERLYLGLCSTCHGPDGRGSWRAALFLVRPGNLSNGATLDARTDQYLFDLIKHGGAPIGRPGMPAFGATLTDSDIRAIVGYVRRLSHVRESGKLLDPDQHQLLVAPAHGEPDAIAGLRRDRIQKGRARGHGHELHGAHAEGRDGLVANQEHVGCGPRDNRSANLVGRGTDDGPPEARGERREQHDEEQDG